MYIPEPPTFVQFAQLILAGVVISIAAGFFVAAGINFWKRFRG